MCIYIFGTPYIYKESFSSTKSYIYAFIYSFNQYLLSTYHMPGIALNAWDIIMNCRDMTYVLLELTFSEKG